MRISIQIKIMLGVGLLATVAALTAVYAVFAADVVGRSVPRVEQAMQDALRAEHLDGLISQAVMESRGIYLANDPAEAITAGRRLEAVLQDIRRVDVAKVEQVARNAGLDADRVRTALAAFLTIRQGFVDQAVYGNSRQPRAEGDNELARASRLALSDLVDQMRSSAQRSAAGEVERARMEAREAKATVIMAAIACGLLALGPVLVLSVLMIARPIRRLTELMNRLAGGETDLPIAESQRQDEIGDMERALYVLRDAVKRNNDLLAELRHRDLKVAVLREQATVRDRVVAFDQTLRSWIARLANLISHLTDAASTMTAASMRSRQGTEALTEASRHAASDADSVALSAEKLSESVDQIERRIADSAGVVRQTVDRARATGATVDELVSFAGRVGSVVQVIGEIAGQTNLLALNATIEAARAGEAGRGFAVVAQEVKSLASQTARATAEISDQVAAIQQSSTASAEALGAIQSKIAEVDIHSGAIALTADAQRAAARQIAASIRATATHAKEMALLAESLRSASQDSAESASTFIAIVRDIDSQAVDMGREVERFFAGLKSA